MSFNLVPSPSHSDPNARLSRFSVKERHRPRDQPFVSAEIINELVKAHRQTGKSIVASAYRKARGVPVLFARELFAEIATLKTEEGARQLIAKHISRVATICFPQGAFDVDTPRDYERVLSLSRASSAETWSAPMKTIGICGSFITSVLVRFQQPDEKS